MHDLQFSKRVHVGRCVLFSTPWWVLSQHTTISLPLHYTEVVLWPGLRAGSLTGQLQCLEGECVFGGVPPPH